MRIWSLLAAFFALLLTLSCGGGGGNGGGGGGPYSLVRVELPGRDPLNIVVGQSVSFELAGYNALTGRRDVLQATSWLTDNPGVGTIAQDGTFTAIAPGTAHINATWAGTPASQQITIVVRPAGLARLTGTVRNEATNAAVGGIVVVFFDANNVEVGRATTLANGTFLAQVPTNTVRMNLDTASLSGWLNQWKYRNIVYQAGNAIPNCHATIVTTPLVGNQTSNIVDPIKIYDNTRPPPFPDGCT